MAGTIGIIIGGARRSSSAIGMGSSISRATAIHDLERNRAELVVTCKAVEVDQIQNFGGT